MNLVFYDKKRKLEMRLRFLMLYPKQVIGASMYLEEKYNLNDLAINKSRFSWLILLLKTQHNYIKMKMEQKAKSLPKVLITTSWTISVDALFEVLWYICCCSIHSVIICVILKRIHLPSPSGISPTKSLSVRVYRWCCWCCWPIDFEWTYVCKRKQEQFFSLIRSSLHVW